MPQRILLFEHGSGTCALLSHKDHAPYNTYYIKNLGIDYDSESTWLHPLSPMRSAGKSTSNFKPMKTSDEGVQTYKGWMGLTASRKTRHSQAALVVQKFYQRAAYQGLRNVFHGVEKPSAGLVRPQIWAFGYGCIPNGLSLVHQGISNISAIAMAEPLFGWP
jgi:hypothetical protein